MKRKSPSPEEKTGSWLWWRCRGVELPGPKRVGSRCPTGIVGDLGSRAAWPPPTGSSWRQPSGLSRAHSASARGSPTKVAPLLDPPGGDQRRGTRVLRPRRRAADRSPRSQQLRCQLLVCQRIYEAAGVLGLQSTSLLLRRYHSPPWKFGTRSIADFAPAGPFQPRRPSTRVGLFERPLQLAPRLALGDRRPLVILLLAPCQRQLELDLALAVVQPQRDQRVARLADLS